MYQSNQAPNIESTEKDEQGNVSKKQTRGIVIEEVKDTIDLFKLHKDSALNVVTDKITKLMTSKEF